MKTPNRRSIDHPQATSRSCPLRRASLLAAIIALAFGSWACTTAEQAAETAAEPTKESEPSRGPIPVIYDTDIGTDIDDTWALALILDSPELDLQLVVTDSGDTRARAALTAKFLEAAGSSDIPIGIGVHEEKDIKIPQDRWIGDYRLDDYPGVVHEDGVGAMIEMIQGWPDDELVLLAVGPVPNLAEALRREPSIAQKVRVVAMSGSVDKGYVGSDEPSPEYNVFGNVEAARALYEAEWDLLIAPLDTAGQIEVSGDDYQRLLRSDRPVIQALIENYREWAKGPVWGTHDADVKSSTLFDALAVALVFDESLCQIENVSLKVADDGKTVRRADGKTVRAALGWPDGGLDRFERLIADRLTAP